jgi:hypothetical protein
MPENHSAAQPPVVAPANPQTLQTFQLSDLAQYTKEGVYSSAASTQFHLFFVGRDDVHSVLKHILSRVQVSLYLNMFGYDDEELNDVIMAKAVDPGITMLITLDKSQSGGVAEKKLLQADQEHALAQFNTHFTIGQSLTHQISHTKGFVADGKIAAEGSTNWSVSGEGVWTVKGGPGTPGYKAQNNTQTVFVDPDSVVRFQTELIAEHMIARDQEAQTVDPKHRQRKLPIGDVHSPVGARPPADGAMQPPAAPAGAAPAHDPAGHHPAEHRPAHHGG